MPVSTPSAAWSACTKMVEAASHSCAPPQPVIPSASEPNWDAMASSFAALSTALTWGSIFLAILAIVAGVAWARFVAAGAKEEARAEAQRCTDKFVKEWLRDVAPTIVAQHVELLTTTTISGSDDDANADDIGNAAG